MQGAGRENVYFHRENIQINPFYDGMGWGGRAVDRILVRTGDA